MYLKLCPGMTAEARMKKTFVVIFILCLICSLYGQEKKINEIDQSVVNQIEEWEPIHKIIHSDGRNFIIGRIEFDDSKSYQIACLIDTGCPVSYLNRNNNIENIINSNIKKDGKLLAQATFEGFCINNWNLTVRISDFSQAEKKVLGNVDVYGIIGNDILMQNNFYISITKKEFAFNYKKSNDKSADAKKYDLNPYGKEQNKFSYQVIIEDDFFRSQYLNPQYQIDKKSKYIIDTGSYCIFTSISDFYEQIEVHKYKYNIAQKNQNEYGICLIPNAKVFEKEFYDLYALGGKFGQGNLKVLGNQILSAFDLYFDKCGTDIVQNIVFVPVPDEDYKKYRNQNDKSKKKLDIKDYL